MTTERVKLLDEAADRIAGKGDEYGSPEDNFKGIAGLWSEYLGFELFPHDVALMMTLLKVARLKSDPSHRDSMLDIAGYAGCLVEVAPKPPLAEPTDFAPPMVLWHPSQHEVGPFIQNPETD